MVKNLAHRYERAMAIQEREKVFLGSIIGKNVMKQDGSWKIK